MTNVDILFISFITLASIFFMYKIIFPLGREIRNCDTECRKISQSYEDYVFYREQGKKNLTKRLYEIAKLENIPVKIHTDLGTAAGTFSYKANRDRTKFCFKDSEICLLEKCSKETDYSILAHELGHFYAIKNDGDQTEERADEYALKICKSLISHNEEKALRVSLQIYFGDSKKL